MKIIIGVCFILLVSSARGHNEVCRITDEGMEICEKANTTITHVRKKKLSAPSEDDIVIMKFDRDITIGPNAFSTLDPKDAKSVIIEMHGPIKPNKSGLHTLTLHPDSFVGLSKTSNLYIWHANINLYERTLIPITNLQKFECMYCGLTEVPTEMWRNNITRLEPDMFDFVPKLAYLTLNNNHITSIPKGVFDKLKSLTSVDLSNNDIEIIEPGALSGLNMYFLGLLDNKVDKIIETGTFSNATIKFLWLKNSNITELKPRAFDGLSVQLLHLGKNKLTQIGAEDFFGLDANFLDLGDNKIKKIAPDAFKNTKVKALRLHNNPIDMGDKGNWGLPESTEISI